MRKKRVLHFSKEKRVSTSLIRPVSNKLHRPLPEVLQHGDELFASRRGGRGAPSREEERRGRKPLAAPGASPTPSRRRRPLQPPELEVDRLDELERRREDKVNLCLPALALARRRGSIRTLSSAGVEGVRQQRRPRARVGLLEQEGEDARRGVPGEGGGDGDLGGERGEVLVRRRGGGGWG